MAHINLEEAQTRLPDLIAAANRGEEVVIMSEGQPAVRLVPAEPVQPRPRFGSARGKILFMADDFDEPLEDFRDYME